jgi:hypothetical protein
MAQLEFFPRSQLASWRDPTASRNYSPEREQFRREHERHREWGLRQRHGRRAMYLRLYSDIVAPADRAGSSRASGPSALVSEPADTEPLPVEASSGDVSRGGGPACAGGGEAVVDPADKTTPAATAAPADQVACADQPTCAVQPASADHSVSAGQAVSADQTQPADQTRPPGQAERCERAGCAAPNKAGLVHTVDRCRRPDSVTRWTRSGRPRRPGLACPPARPWRLGPAIPSAPIGDRGPPTAPPTRGHRPARIDQNHPGPWRRDRPRKLPNRQHQRRRKASRPQILQLPKMARVGVWALL